MNIAKTEFHELNEMLYEYVHPSGFKVFVLPKREFKTKVASIFVNLGREHDSYLIAGENKITKMPDGTVHFLEHITCQGILPKIYALGSKFGAMVIPGFTQYTITSSTKFLESIKIFLSEFQNIQVYDEFIKKERRIIREEIKERRDEVELCAYFNFLEAIYFNNPIKNWMWGNKESIETINKLLLEKTIDTFFNLSNMTMLVVGDVDCNEIFELVKENVTNYLIPSPFKLVYKNEPAEIKVNLTQQKMKIASPYILCGYKGINFKDNLHINKIKYKLSVNIILEMLFGEGTQLHEKLLDEGVIGEPIRYYFEYSDNYSCSCIEGQVSNVTKSREIIETYIEKFKNEGFDEALFKRIKKVFKTQYIKNLDSLESLGWLFAETCFSNIGLFDELKVYDEIDLKYVMEIYGDHFDNSKFALSAIFPK